MNANVFMIPATVFHSIVRCVASTSSFGTLMNKSTAETQRTQRFRRALSVNSASQRLCGWIQLTKEQIVQECDARKAS
jgi:hypothetical protein